MLTHLLDTTAWIAHLFNEPGTEEVIALFDDPENVVGICTLSLVELHGRLKFMNAEAEFERVVEAYRPLFSEMVVVDQEVANRAISIRKAASARVPTIDSIIAAAASLHNAVLIHRDQHLQSVPPTLVKQYVLSSDKSTGFSSR